MRSDKITKLRQSEEKRRYEDACGLAYALELIGERWAPLVLRELMHGPRRFSELKADLPGISANVLTQRLTELEARGLVRKARLPSPALVQVYQATEWGLEAAPVLRALGRWAVRSPDHDPELFVSAVSIIMSMETMFDAERAGDLQARIGFRLGGTGYVAEIRDGRLFDRRPGSGRGLRRDLHRGADPARGDRLWRHAARHHRGRGRSGTCPAFRVPVPAAAQG